MTQKEIEQAAEKYSEKFLDDPHNISEESFIAGAIWIIENMPNGLIGYLMKSQELKWIYEKYNYLLK